MLITKFGSSFSHKTSMRKGLRSFMWISNATQDPSPFFLSDFPFYVILLRVILLILLWLLGEVVGCPDFWSNIVRDVSERVFLHEISMWTGRFGAGSYLSVVNWVSFMQLTKGSNRTKIVNFVYCKHVQKNPGKWYLSKGRYILPDWLWARTFFRSVLFFSCLFIQTETLVFPEIWTYWCSAWNLIDCPGF